MARFFCHVAQGRRNGAQVIVDAVDGFEAAFLAWCEIGNGRGDDGYRREVPNMPTLRFANGAYLCDEFDVAISVSPQ